MQFKEFKQKINKKYGDTNQKIKFDKNEAEFVGYIGNSMICKSNPYSEFITEIWNGKIVGTF